jgi:penicillin-binding protein 2A
MDTNELLQKIKRGFIQFWIWLKPYLIRFNTKRRRLWKKYHLTKLIILSVLSIALLFSIYLAYLARTANVNALRAGLSQTTTIMDENGEEAGTLYAQKGTFIELEEISPLIEDAVISTEDQRFYSHRGFDPIGIGRAGVGYLINREIVGGGSTITQQLAKNAYLTADQTMMRKLRELFLAIEIEKHYSKEAILEMYLNNAYFGNGVWGVQDASLRYFGKPASDVTVEEAATIAAMLKGPSLYNPVDNYERSIERRNVVLQLMANNEVISEAEAQEAASRGLSLVNAYDHVDGYRYPYYFDAVINEAVNRYGFEEEDLLNNGYTIYTSLNQTHQQQMDIAYQNDSLFQIASDGTLVQSASVALNPQTGGVTAVVGGRGEYTFRGFNRATQMRRQPGSIMKPLGVYTAALEEGYEVDSLIKDELLSYGDTEYTPTNLSGTYQGEVPMYEALARSLNAPAVWLLNEMGLRRGIRQVEEFGIPVDEGDYHLGAIALGGMERGVSPLQMASAYSVFPNGGVRIEPFFITQIVDATGAIVVDNTSPRSKRVISEEIAEDMNRMLLSVFSSGTAQNNQPAGYTVAGKTGTTQTTHDVGATDQWIVGYTPDIVVTSWMGFDQTTEDHYLTSSSSQGVGMLLKAEMEGILPHTEQTAFVVEEPTSEQIEGQDTNDFLNQVQQGLEDAGNMLRDGAGQLRDGAAELFNRFRNR